MLQRRAAKRDEKGREEWQKSRKSGDGQRLKKGRENNRSEEKVR